MARSILDPKFRYRPAASHDDASVFRRRMQARRKLALRKQRQESSAARAPGVILLRKAKP